MLVIELQAVDYLFHLLVIHSNRRMEANLSVPLLWAVRIWADFRRLAV
jgi:hypothetical protein